MTSDDTTIDAPATTTAPPIGTAWPGQGGIYLGIARGRDGQPDEHLILALAVPPKHLKWTAAIEWAKTVEADGHTDFAVPTRFQSALIYANGQDLVDSGSWHWTSTQYSADYACSQDFSDGNQVSYDKEYEARVRAVRRFAV